MNYVKIDVIVMKYGFSKHLCEYYKLLLSIIYDFDVTSNEEMMY